MKSLPRCVLVLSFVVCGLALSAEVQNVVPNVAPNFAARLNEQRFAYLQTEAAERDAEEKRFAETKIAWETPAAKTGIPESFRPAVTLRVGANAPLPSLTAARDAIRKLKNENGGTLPDGGVEVVVENGTYSAAETVLALTAEDSGTEKSPIVYRAAENGKAIWSGGAKLAAQNFAPVDDAETLERLRPEARGKVVVIDLRRAGIDVAKLPPMAQRGYGYSGAGSPPWVDLYIDGKPATLARYPNEGTNADNVPPPLRTGEVTRGKMDTPDDNGKTPPIFGYDDDRIDSWTQADELWLMGYWGHLWGCNTSPVESIDTAAKRITLGKPNSYACREKMPYYAYNLLEEIDTPGEWFLSRKTGTLFIWPTEDFSASTTQVVLSTLAAPFVKMRDCSFVSLVGLTFENGCGLGVKVDGGSNVVLAGCTLRRLGGWGVEMRGDSHGVLSCDLETLGGGGVALNSGDYKTLTHGNSFVENCHIASFTRVDRAYAPAVHLDGCGNRIAHNLMHDSPNHAIRLEGMEQTIEYNEIHSVVYESDDQAGIDIWGNPFMRGFVMRYNYFHHIGSGRNVAGQAGIRLDDMISSVLMYGNVFFRTSGGGFGGIQIHGGKDNISDNNLFIDCKSAFSYSPWGEKRWLEMLTGYFGASRRQAGFDPDSQAYREKYPDLADLTQNADRNFAFRNVAIACDAFTRNEHGQNEYGPNTFVAWSDGIFAEISESTSPSDSSRRVPEAVTRYRGKLTIPYDSAVWKKWNVRPLPFPLMGVYRDTFRTTIPETKVNPQYVAE
ncbi:MAG: right-handed parallel beta-helix repeat-containing protein [Thermoguttaceae bacterium]